MPRGIPNNKPAPVAAPVAEEPAPMIFIEPGLDGAIRLNAYGLYAGEVGDALRRALSHLAGGGAGDQPGGAGEGCGGGQHDGEAFEQRAPLCAEDEARGCAGRRRVG